MASSNYSFLIDENKRQVEITYGEKKLKFQLKVKRSFTVIKKLLEAYPNFINIHSLDSILNDPNRAHSDLRIANGFANFLIEKTDKKHVMFVKLDVEKLFKFCRADTKDGLVRLYSRHIREGLSEENKKLIYKNFKGRCNITGIKVFDKVKGNKFFKSLMVTTYDHRRPLSKGGSNELFNWQLLSKLANDEKNKICNICDGIKCEQCALAYPEKFNIIQPTGQDISELRKTD
jgi:hypothetical protein